MGLCFDAYELISFELDVTIATSDEHSNRPSTMYICESHLNILADHGQETH